MFEMSITHKKKKHYFWEYLLIMDHENIHTKRHSNLDRSVHKCFTVFHYKIRTENIYLEHNNQAKVILTLI